MVIEIIDIVSSLNISSSGITFFQFSAVCHLSSDVLIETLLFLDWQFYIKCAHYKLLQIRIFVVRNDILTNYSFIQKSNSQLWVINNNGITIEIRSSIIIHTTQFTSIVISKLLIKKFI